jgi:maltooligosyltrehalose trehalohydrolase
LRHDAIMPRLPGTRTLDSEVLGPAAVLVRWRMGDGATLAMAANLGSEPVAISAPSGNRLFATSDKAIAGGTLAARSTAVFLEPAP